MPTMALIQIESDFQYKQKKYTAQPVIPTMILIYIETDFQYKQKNHTAQLAISTMILIHIYIDFHYKMKISLVRWFDHMWLGCRIDLFIIKVSLNVNNYNCWHCCLVSMIALLMMKVS